MMRQSCPWDRGGDPLSFGHDLVANEHAGSSYFVSIPRLWNSSDDIGCFQVQEVERGHQNIAAEASTISPPCISLRDHLNDDFAKLPMGTVIFLKASATLFCHEQHAGSSSWTCPWGFQQQCILDLSRCRRYNGHQNVAAEARTISPPGIWRGYHLYRY